MSEVEKKQPNNVLETLADLVRPVPEAGQYVYVYGAHELTEEQLEIVRREGAKIAELRDEVERYKGLCMNGASNYDALQAENERLRARVAATEAVVEAAREEVATFHRFPEEDRTQCPLCKAIRKLDGAR